MSHTFGLAAFCVQSGRMLEESKPKPTARRRAQFLAAAAALVCYANTLPNDFCFDDGPLVRDNPRVTAPGQWAAIWTTDLWSDRAEIEPDRDLLYRPVALTTHRLIHAAFGNRAWPHHVANMLLHAAVCALIVSLALQLGGHAAGALVAGVTFAVLPIHAEAVAAVVGRADLLVALGILFAIEAHRRSMFGRGVWNLILWRALAATMAFVAVGAKESGLVVMLLVPLFDRWAWSNDPARSKPGWARTAIRTSYLVVPTAIYLALRFHALGGMLFQTLPLSKTINVLVDAPPWQHAAGVLQLWGMYWVKSIWPAVLSIKYSTNAIRPAVSFVDPYVLTGAAVLTGLSLICVVSWRKGDRRITLLCAALVISYLPTANLLMLIRVFFAERLWYLPSLWAALLLGFLVAPRMKRPAAWVAFGLIVTGLGVRCWVRNAEWKNDGTLYAAAALDQPDGAAALQLYGDWLVTHGFAKEGLERLTKAVEIDLGFADAHRSLAEGYLRLGDLASALDHLRIADMQVPGHDRTRSRLMAVSRELAKRDDRLAELKRGVDAAPNDRDAVLAYVRRLRELGMTTAALGELSRGDERFETDAEWQAEYAVTLVYQNRRDEAIDRYRRCLALDPKRPQTAIELAGLLRERRGPGDVDEAWRWVAIAAKMAPDAPGVLACRAELVALRGNVVEALRLYRRAITKLAPGSAQRRIYENRAKTLGGS